MSSKLIYTVRKREHCLLLWMNNIYHNLFTYVKICIGCFDVLAIISNPFSRFWFHLPLVHILGPYPEKGLPGHIVILFSFIEEWWWYLSLFNTSCFIHRLFVLHDGSFYQPRNINYSLHFMNKNRNKRENSKN